MNIENEIKESFLKNKQVFYHVSRKIVKNDTHAEDIVQTAFLKALKNCDKFEGRSNVNTWIHKIVFNESIMYLRKSNHDLFIIPLDFVNMVGNNIMEHDVADWRPDAEKLYEQSKNIEKVWAAINSLKPMFREVLIARDIEELSIDETCQKLKLSVPAVKTRHLRARRKLKEKLERYPLKIKKGKPKI